MSETPNSPPANDFVGTLDRKSVLSAVAALCAPDRVAAALMKKGLKRLVSSDNWTDEIKRLERYGLSAKHFSGQLREALAFPGDLVLLRHAESGFVLLYRMEQRWLYLGENGSPLSKDVNVEEGDDVEAVVMKLPQSGGKGGRFCFFGGLVARIASCLGGSRRRKPLHKFGPVAAADLCPVDL